MGTHGTQLRPRPSQLIAHVSTSMLLTSLDGEIRGGTDGYYIDGARLLSKLTILVNGTSPETFSGGRPRPVEIVVHGRLQEDGDLLNDALFSKLNWLLGPNGLCLRLTLMNYAPQRTRRFELSMTMAADFADFHEASTGSRQQKADVAMEWDERARELRLSYLHPELPLSCVVQAVPAGNELHWRDGTFIATGTIGPQSSLVWQFDISREPAMLPDAVLARLRNTHGSTPTPRLQTVNPNVALAWRTAVGDLQSLRLGIAAGPEALGAGVPLYQHFFGRDSLTAGWQALLVGPEFLRDALLINASLQGERVDDQHDEQPGKMIHQVRTGPLSLLGHDALRKYFGDYATPPDFVAMLAEYFLWTGDTTTTRALLPAAWRALTWLDRYGDVDGDGFVEYLTRSPQGVKNQGWKDAPDSVVDDSGNIAENPLATSELQGYWYAALELGAFLAAWVARDFGLAHRLHRRARRLKRQFNDAFWLENEGHYAQALDSQKRPIRAAGSNDAHLLVTGIVPRERAVRVVQRLLEPDMFTGWGIRTLSSKHPAHNPFSYHRGSVWPVEHGTLALGLAAYGLWDELGTIARCVFEASALFEEHRLPEVLGGLQRDESGSHPGTYPGASSPQAWSASTIPMLLQSLLGFHPIAPIGVVTLDPHLPTWLPELRLTGVRVGRSEIDIHAWRDRGGQTRFQVRKRGPRLLILRQPPPQDPRGNLSTRLKGLLPR